MINRISGSKHDEHGFYFQVYIAHKGREKMVLVDADDYFAHVHGKNWCIQNCGHSGCNSEKFYVKINVGPRSSRKTLYLHRVVTGALPGIVPDHKDGNGLNCRQHNLKLTTQSDNALRKKYYCGRPVKTKAK